MVSRGELKNGIFADAPMSDEYIVIGSDLVAEPRALMAMMEIDATIATRPLFRRRLTVDSDVPQLEREYMTTTTGGDAESVCTRVTRQFSGPLTEKLLATVRERFIPDTHLIRYGEGDWNDSLQPADPKMRDWMVSSWTVALLYQQLTRYAEVLKRAGASDEATAARSFCTPRDAAPPRRLP